MGDFSTNTTDQVNWQLTANPEFDIGNITVTAK